MDDSFHVRSKEEDLYDYVRIEDIDAIDQAAGVKREKLIAADGPANYMRTVLNAMDEETYQCLSSIICPPVSGKICWGQVRIHWILSESNKIIKSRRKYESDRRIEQKRRAVLENVLENLRQRIGKIAQELEEGQKILRVCMNITGKIIRKWISTDMRTMTISRRSYSR